MELTLSDAFTHDTFLSPFTWRYGSDAMRAIWSETYKRRLWRRIWVALAEAQCAAGIVTAEQAADLRAHQDHIDLKRSSEIEAVIHHDLMAEIRCFAEQCTVGGGILHLGATSADIEDNADALRLRESLKLILTGVRGLLYALAEQIDRHAETVCMAFTHLQPAEPTTIGYRLAGYAQDLLADYDTLAQTHDQIRGKGLKGAVGTRAAFAELLAGSAMTPEALETRVMAALNLPAYAITGQTYPRRQDWQVLNALAGLGLSVYKLAFDLRLLQSPSIGEWAEPFGASQVGSSAMPFKQNPIHAENLDSLARFLAALPRVAWDNAAHSLLERTLDDSANRRLILPEAFLTADELLRRAGRIVKGLQINLDSIQRNLARYGVFAATERLLMAGVKRGADRQAWHEIIREHSLIAWDALRQGLPNPLADRLAADIRITQVIEPAVVRDLLRAESHIGDAPQRALAQAQRIRAALSENSKDLDH